MSNDKMREAIERSYKQMRKEQNYQPLSPGMAYAAGWKDALSQHPESEPGAFIGGIFWFNNEKHAVAQWMPFPDPLNPDEVRGLLTAAPSIAQPSAQVPAGFNLLAYNRKTGEWMYVNHAGEWHLCPCPVDRTNQVPDGWSVDEVGESMHVYGPDGRWCGFMPCNGPKHALMHKFLKALTSATPIAEKDHG